MRTKNKEKKNLHLNKNTKQIEILKYTNAHIKTLLANKNNHTI